MSLKEQILAAAAAAAKTTLAPVTAWGVPAFIKIMSGTERDDWEGGILGENGKVNHTQFRAKLLVKALADESGARIFSEDDLATLSAGDSIEIDRLFQIARERNKVTKKDEDELVKNS